MRLEPIDYLPAVCVDDEHFSDTVPFSPEQELRTVGAPVGTPHELRCPEGERQAGDAAAGVCTDPRLNPAWNRIETGDFTVRDAAP